MADEVATTVDTAGVTRTETGEIAPPQVTRREAQTSTETQTTSPKETPEQSHSEPAEGETLLTTKEETKEAPKAEGAPEAYTDFTVPEGYTLDEAVAKEAGTLFKGMDLSQAQAQSLVDFYVAKTQEALRQPFETYNAMRKEWRDEVTSDPVLSHRLPQIKTAVTQMLDTHLGPKLAGQFREAMDLTGVGDHPAFVRAFDALSQLLVEPRGHVAGNRASPFGQTRDAQPRSAATAMYPHLPSREA